MTGGQVWAYGGRWGIHHSVTNLGGCQPCESLSPRCVFSSARPRCIRTGRRSSTGRGRSPTGRWPRRSPASRRPCKAKGLRPGDRVAYLAPNCAEVLMAHFAVPLAGGVLVTLNTRLSPAEIAHIVEHSGAGFLLGDAPLLRARSAESLRRHHAAGDRDPARGDRRADPSWPVRRAMTTCSPPAATNPWRSRSPTRTTRSA